MREVSVESFVAWTAPAETTRNEVEILMPVVQEALGAAGLSQDDIGFTCSGSTDYLVGQPFSFVTALDAIGPWPPIIESHVEMDGAWALYEAWTRLQHGDLDTALVYAFGKMSLGDMHRVLTLQLDPYCVVPLWPDHVALAGLQASVLANGTGADVEVEPAPAADGAAAIVLRAGGDGPVIRGIDHRIEAHSLGVRDLSVSPSTALAGSRAGVRPDDVAVVHAPFAHQAGIVRAALGVSDVRPSCGPLMVGGLMCIGQAAELVRAGEAARAVGHATSGPCLQQNLVCVVGGS